MYSIKRYFSYSSCSLRVNSVISPNFLLLWSLVILHIKAANISALFIISTLLWKMPTYQHYSSFPLCFGRWKKTLSWIYSRTILRQNINASFVPDSEPSIGDPLDVLILSGQLTRKKHMETNMLPNWRTDMQQEILKGWETAYLKVKQVICDHLTETKTYTGIKGSIYLANVKKASLTREGTDCTSDFGVMASSVWNIRTDINALEVTCHPA